MCCVTSELVIIFPVVAERQTRGSMGYGNNVKERNEGQCTGLRFSGNSSMIPDWSHVYYKY